MPTIFRIALLLAAATLAQADEVRVAVAANFKPCLEALASQYEHGLIISSGSTGQHHAQIVAGAPFDVFLAADIARPSDLEQRGLVVPGSRFTYAQGELVLWWPTPPVPEPADVCAALAHGSLRHLAVANPGTAPYGAAAVAVIDACGGLGDVRQVTGRSVGQAWQFVASGNAQAGFVARSQVVGAGHGLVLPVAAGMHEPIAQQAVLLAASPRLEAARAFLEFLRSDAARLVIAGYGYVVPDESAP